MHAITTWSLLEILVALAATHLLVSFSQTVLHRILGHWRVGGMFHKNHINYHHTYYSRDHLVSPAYLVEERNITVYFLAPVIMLGIGAYFALPLPVFMAVVIASGASFYVHILFDREYHVEGSWLLRFAWFRRKQELHFVHHRHANANFAVIDFFWDRLLGTFRSS